MHLSDVGGGIAFEKRTDRKSGKEVETLSFSNEDETTQDYRKIQEVLNLNSRHA